jgi:hypothetical protein
MEEYRVYEEKAIAARKVHRDKETEDRGGWAYDIVSLLTEVKVLAPGYN